MISSAPDRQQRILELLRTESSLRTSSLPGILGVTPMTIWRDLSHLEEQGLVTRRRGRVTHPQPGRNVEPAFEAKRDTAYAAKERIARYAARHFIGEGETIAIDGGTTVALLAEQSLPANLTIFTNSLNTAQLFLQHPARPSVYCCGGFLRAQSGTFIGREALGFFSRRRFDRYFLSATGVDAKAGISDLTLEDNEVKQAMAAASREVILLADRSKIGVVSHMQVFPWKAVDHFVTDATARNLKAFERLKADPLSIHRA